MKIKLIKCYEEKIIDGVFIDFNDAGHFITENHIQTFNLCNWIVLTGHSAWKWPPPLDENPVYAPGGLVVGAHHQDAPLDAARRGVNRPISNPTGTNGLMII